MAKVQNRLVDAEPGRGSIEETLDVIARLLPLALVVFERLQIDTRQAELFASRSEYGQVVDSSALELELAAWLAQAPVSGSAERCGRCHILSSSSDIFPSISNLGPRVTVLVLPGREHSLDALAFVHVSPSGSVTTVYQFLCSTLALMQLFADRELDLRQRVGFRLQIERAKKEWEAAVDALPQLVCLVNRDGVVVRANRALEGLRLGDVRTAAGMHFVDLLQKQGILDTAIAATIGALERGEGGASPTAASCSVALWAWNHWRKAAQHGPFELSGLASRDGKVFDLRVQQCRLPDQSGMMLSYDVVVLEDVTERHQARHLLENFNEQLRHEVDEKTAALRRINERLELEIDAHKRDMEALRLSEYRYHSFAEKTLTGIYLAERGTVTYCNKRFAQMLGYNEDELTGRPLSELLGEGYDMVSTTDPAFARSESGRELQVSGKDGSRVWIHVTEMPYAAGERDITIANVLDVTARKDSEHRLLASTRRTAQLSEQLLIAQEQERARISRELHDGVGQRINAIKLTLDNIVSKRGPDEGARRNAELVELAGSLREAIEEIRRVSMALRPSILDDLGITATLTWFVREFRRVMPGIEVECELSLDESGMSSLLKTELFRITQEAFNNVAKHANASRVQFCLKTMPDGESILRISDDGQGVVRDEEQGQRGVGLQSMQERAELTNGDLFIVSRDGRGTTIIGRWPHAARE